MSKRSLFFGTASGKLGNMVLYRANGEERQRTYIAKIKNPKTLAQMVNRLSMANFAAVYRALSPVISEGFPNRKSNQSGYNAFMSANKSAKSAAIPKAQAEQGYTMPAGMIIARGSLAVSTDLTFVQGSGFVSGIAANASGAIASPAQLATALQLSGANPNGLPAAVKVTVVVAEYEDEGFKLYHSQLESVARQGAPAFSLPAGFSLGAVNGKLAILVADSDNVQGEVMAAIVVSYTDANGKLQVTNSSIFAGDAESDYVTQFLEGGSVWYDTLESLGYNKELYLSTTNTGATASGGGSVRPASVSSAVIGSINMPSQQSQLSAPSGSTNVVINGNNLENASLIQVRLNNSTFDVTITSQAKTKIEGTINVSGLSGYVTSGAILIDGEQKLTGAWSEDSNPL